MRHANKISVQKPLGKRSFGESGKRDKIINII
jgi:hypothetical protein